MSTALAARTYEITVRVVVRADEEDEATGVLSAAIETLIGNAGAIVSFETDDVTLIDAGFDVATAPHDV